jgi:hypothetical protein
VVKAEMTVTNRGQAAATGLRLKTSLPWVTLTDTTGKHAITTITQC